VGKRERKKDLEILITGFEDAGRGHQLKNAGGLDPGKGKETDFPLESSETTLPC